LQEATFRGLVGRLAYDVLVRRGDAKAKKRFAAVHGCGPPGFLTIAPGKTCNLRCAGCYAAAGPSSERLGWATLNRIVREARDLWGTRFFVVSGGEPFAYRDEGKGIMDLAERHPDCFFLLYSNGTLIKDPVPRRLERSTPGSSTTCPSGGPTASTSC